MKCLIRLFRVVLRDELSDSHSFIKRVISVVVVVVVDIILLLISGGNTGIGKATALHLARKGARVILACRNQNKAQDAIADIQKVGAN